MLGTSMKQPNGRPDSTTVRCESLTAGYMVSPKTMAAKWTTTRDVTFNINYGFRKITLYFSSWRTYKAEFYFRDLEVHNLHPERTNGEHAYFTLITKHPPKYWEEHPSAKHRRYKDRDAGPWQRVTKIPIDKEAASLMKNIPSTIPLQRQESVAQCLPLGELTAFRVSISYTSKYSYHAFKQVVRLSHSYRLVTRHEKRYHFDKKLSVVNAYENATSSERTTTTSAMIPSSILENFDKYYTLESYVSHRIIIPKTVDETFYKLYEKMTPGKASNALRHLMIMANTGGDDIDDDIDDEYDDGSSSIATRHIWNPTEALRDFKERDVVKDISSRTTRDNKNDVLIRKALVTPTTILFELPRYESANRVLRDYNAYADHFIRVQFVEEDCHRLQNSSRARHSSDNIYKRISHALKYGIQIGTSHYEFLAFSNSQLREHGCWFFAPTDKMDATKIRDGMGDFSNEKVVAKYAARMGQCFSSTYPTVELRKNQVGKEEDIKRNGYTFSDGVGLISPSLAMMVATKMRLSGTAYPSAFQFRLGGAKGVLSVSPKIAGSKLALRPSQEKFDSDHRMLEINRVSSRSIAFLNRQIIIILSTLGVPDQVFLELLREMLNELDCITLDPDRCMAMLRTNSDEDGISQGMIALVQHGFLASGDPYIAQLLSVYRLYNRKEIKDRAKIQVTKGAHLLGVMDETNTLKENEVFCQLSPDGPITGRCLVYRLPALHEGDARVLKAVKCSKLNHLRNVIVFSQRGERDVPSMLSGGDLDGDTYSIIWDKRLFPSKKMRNREPMDVTTPEPKKVDQVKIGHIQGFFVDYIKSDNLGQIANAHLAHADASAMGVSDPICKKLAQLHSHAVDFPKTGVKADFVDSLRAGIYPDFMEKKDKPSYESKKILGQIYHFFKPEEFQQYRSQLRIQETEYDERLRYPGMENFFARARQLKQYYDEELISLMDHFGIPTEAEFMTGCIIRYSKREHRSHYDLRSMARRDMMRFKERWRRKEFATLGKRSRKIPTREQVEHDCAKAAAFYYVTYHKDEQEETQLYYGAYRKNRNLLLSFAWLAQELLFKVLKQHQYGIIAPFQDPIAPVEEEYESFEEYLEPKISDEEPVSDDGCF